MVSPFHQLDREQPRVSYYKGAIGDGGSRKANKIISRKSKVSSSSFQAPEIRRPDHHVRRVKFYTDAYQLFTRNIRQNHEATSFEIIDAGRPEAAFGAAACHFGWSSA